MLSSLERLCLKQIAKDIKTYCEDCEDLHQFRYLLGPFDGLGSWQIQELLDLLAKDKKLKPSYLQVMLHPGVKTLNLSICTYIVNDSVMRTIAMRSKNLTQLSLKNCIRISPRVLQEIPCFLTYLRSLDLTGCSKSCTNTLLCNLGCFCHNLQVLKLAACQKVNDSGIRGLCGDSQTPGCSKIVDLDLSSTNVSSEGVLAVMSTQTQLQNLSLSHAWHTKQSQFFNGAYLSLDKNNLRFLDLSHTSVDDLVIANVCHLCPELNGIHLNDCQHLTALCLNHIKTLQNLKHFQLDILYILDFEHDLEPFLRDCGSRLESLRISRAFNVSTDIFGKYCQNLSSLYLPESCNLLGACVMGDKTLTEACAKLKCLSLRDCKFSDILSLSEHLAAILSDRPSNLEELNLSGIPALTSKWILPFVESGGFSKLRRLDISRCDICVHLLEELVESCPHMVCIDVSGCWDVTRGDVKCIKQIANELGRQLQINWK